MVTYKIITDSAAILRPDQLERANVDCLNFEYTIDGQNYPDDAAHSKLSLRAFYDLLRAGAMPTTNQINLQRYMDAFERYLQQGQDVLYLCFSSGLSGSFNTSNIAAQELMEKYPGRKVICADTLTATYGQGMLVRRAAALRDAGASIEQVRDWVIGNRFSMNAIFVVDDLNHLKRGGRVSPAVAFAGTMLNIKPCLMIDHEGKLATVAKARGRKKALDWVVENVQAQLPTGDEIAVVHSDCQEEAEQFRRRLMERYPGFVVSLEDLGPLLGAHTGPNLIGTVFFGNERNA